MTIYNRVYNSQLGQIVTTEQEIVVTFKSSVNTATDLPTTDENNTVRYVYDSNHLYCMIAGTWIDQGVFDMTDLNAEHTIQEAS